MKILVLKFFSSNCHFQSITGWKMPKDTEMMLSVLLRITNFCVWRNLPFQLAKMRLEKLTSSSEIITNICWLNLVRFNLWNNNQKQIIKSWKENILKSTKSIMKTVPLVSLTVKNNFMFAMTKLKNAKLSASKKNIFIIFELIYHFQNFTEVSSWKWEIQNYLVPPRKVIMKICIWFLSKNWSGNFQAPHWKSNPQAPDLPRIVISVKTLS